MQSPSWLRLQDPEDDAAGVEVLAARLLQAEGHVPVADAHEEEDAISDADDMRAPPKKQSCIRDDSSDNRSPFGC